MDNSIVLAAEALSFERDNKKILNQVSLSLTKGDLHIVLGPNGAGKSTLIKLLSNELQPDTGSIQLGGKDLAEYSSKALSHYRAVLPQLRHLAFPMTVYEVCALGRTPYMGASLESEDKKIIEESLLAVDMQAFSDQDYASLSGGEQQRVHIARVLCQSTEVLFLDEPLSALDIRHQIQVMNLLLTLRDKGKTILCIMHDLNLALRYASKLTFLKQGKVIFQGSPAQANTPDLYEELYGVSAKVSQSEDGLIQVDWF